MLLGVQLYSWGFVGLMERLGMHVACVIAVEVVEILEKSM